MEISKENICEWYKLYNDKDSEQEIEDKYPK